MGCDIHAIVEFEDRHGDTSSLALDEFWVPRNYPLFAALAGVRGDGPPPKGRPEKETKWLSDSGMKSRYHGHSHSWATVEEWELALVSSETGSPEYWAILAAAKELIARGVQQVRISYWFDN